MALAAMWVAVVLICAWYPAYPVFGTNAQITLSSIVFSALTAPILGPLWGALAGFVLGWTIPLVNAAASIGPLTFLGPLVAAVISGLALFNHWKEAAVLFGAEMIIWFAHPFAWYQDMFIVTWQSWLAFAFIVIPPVRKWISNSIFSRNPATLPVALWCLAWIARISDVTMGNNIGVWVNGWGVPNMYMFWVPMTVYYAVAESLNCLAGATIGTAVLLALKRSSIRITALDSLQPYRKSGVKSEVNVARA